MFYRMTATTVVIMLAVVGFPRLGGGAARVSDAPATAAAGAGAPLVAQQQPEVVEYEERGDPDLEPEKVTVDVADVEAAMTRSEEALPRPLKNRAAFAKRMTNLSIAYAQSTPPTGRNTTPDKVREFMSLFNYTDLRTRYCAMGVAYAACRAYAELPEVIQLSPGNTRSTLKSILPDIRTHYFTPSPSCYLMMEAAKRKPGQFGGWVRKGTREPQRGWLVLFDWADSQGRRSGMPEHIGIVVEAHGLNPASISTVEYNTTRRRVVRSRSGGNVTESDGGAVAEKTRFRADILGYIRTY